MKFVIFGLSISSSWGNGHATIWRGLCRALIGRRHRIVFFEKDVPYYAAHRDLNEIPGGDLILYSQWEAVRSRAERELADADIGIVTSYCPDGIAASDLVLSSSAGLHVFYDLDTPVTLDALKKGISLSYIGPQGLRHFDLVLSYTGGESLNKLKLYLGAKQVQPLYGSADPDAHKPVAVPAENAADLSYLGTYAQDRQDALRLLFIEPARRLVDRKFKIGGSLYPDDFPWLPNISYERHLAPPDHPSFYCASKLTLSVTRQVMAQTGFCPSGRLFEASLCGVPILTDNWKGLEYFFEPGREVLTAATTEESIDAIELPLDELKKIAQRARDRTLSMHTAECRGRELEDIICAAQG